MPTICIQCPTMSTSGAGYSAGSSPGGKSPGGTGMRDMVGEFGQKAARAITMSKQCSFMFFGAQFVTSVDDGVGVRTCSTPNLRMARAAHMHVRCAHNRTAYNVECSLSAVALKQHINCTYVAIVGLISSTPNLRMVRATHTQVRRTHKRTAYNVERSLSAVALKHHINCTYTCRSIARTIALHILSSAVEVQLHSNNTYTALTHASPLNAQTRCISSSAV